MFSMMIGLPERARHVIGGDAGDDVGRPASREWHDQGDRAPRIVGLCRSRQSGKADREASGNQTRQDAHHCRFLSLQASCCCFMHAYTRCMQRPWRNALRQPPH